jgi:RNA-directed DNA polymerase
MSTTERSVYEWQDLDWKSIEQQVFKLQKRIYQASQRNDLQNVRRLQRLLLHSWAARCLAVRRVTQDNRGKRTAGVDGLCALPSKQRLALAQDLKLGSKAQPTRRVWIPKPGSQEQRPLGIPTIRIRAEQTLAKLALEPEWEARFEPNSYGFRPGRSCQDAIEAIFKTIKQKSKYVLDADISHCFDKIDHQALLKKLHTFPGLRRTIRAWLKAGVLEEAQWSPTSEGTPQGGCLSPLLANVALHGMETAVVNAFPKEHAPTVVRYADDFVILHSDLAATEKARTIVTRWLAEMGLELKPSKTRITHSFQPYQGNLGFDFLGFHIRQYPAGKTHTSHSTRGQPLGFKTLITPSQEALRRHYAALRDLIDQGQALSQEHLIRQLYPLIRGWAHYYAHVVSKQAFSDLDHLVFLKLLRWAYRRHPQKSRHWIVRKYWRLETGHWTFGTREGMRLFSHMEVPIQRHIKVKGTKSFYDGDWLYWATRMGRHPETSPRRAHLLKRQHGQCARCGLYFATGDIIELDHIQPRSQGGHDSYENWQLLHGHCHDQKTRSERSTPSKSIRDKDRRIEEPNEGKLSNSVLETSRQGDLPA